MCLENLHRLHFTKFFFAVPLGHSELFCLHNSFFCFNFQARNCVVWEGDGKSYFSKTKKTFSSALWINNNKEIFQAHAERIVLVFIYSSPCSKLKHKNERGKNLCRTNNTCNWCARTKWMAFLYRKMKQLRALALRATWGARWKLIFSCVNVVVSNYSVLIRTHDFFSLFRTPFVSLCNLSELWFVFWKSFIEMKLTGTSIINLRKCMVSLSKFILGKEKLSFHREVDQNMNLTNWIMSATQKPFVLYLSSNLTKFVRCVMHPTSSRHSVLVSHYWMLNRNNCKNKV